MKALAKQFVKTLPFFGKILRERDKYAFGYPPGHFYSPVPCLDEIKAREDDIFQPPNREIPGIDLNEPEQLELFDAFIPFYQELPFECEKKNGLRYSFDNIFYCYSDAIFLYCMMRHLRPKRVIEVGSGHSSCLMLDVNERYFEDTIALTFIEPYPQNLFSLIKESDKQKVEIIEKPLQNVELDRFLTLTAGDILFIDSTHVSKLNSDVNHLFFKILPALQSGVYIHFHDIFYPFEYPKNWVYSGIAWNEAYLLRSFLQYNQSFKIMFFNTFLEQFHAELFYEKMPLCMKNTGGSLWLKKV